MADWFYDRDYPNRAYEAYPFPYYQEKETQPTPAQCMSAQAQPFSCTSPTLTVLLSPNQQGTQQPCDFNPAPKGENPRELRNKAEKQRRDKMNESIARLASIVPPVIKPGRKMNKRNVLRLAAHYLRSHQHVFGNSIDRGQEFSSEFTYALLKNLKGFLITTTYKGLIVVVSPNIQEYLGYTELELLGQNVFSIIHKDDHHLLLQKLFPTSCTLTANGQLLLPQEHDAERKVAEALANEKRSFIIRFKKLNNQRSEPPQYLTCHVEGSLRKSDRAGARFDQVIHIGRRARSRGENPFASGNDIVFVGMVRPVVDTFMSESGLESFKMEYRTRHSIDGEIIQCEQRIALVTGYMTHEVNGVNAMNFMHRDDVRWVIIALREMYDQHRMVGESCYRLMTKNGQFIYMRTLGRLDVDKDTKAVTSFVCTNTVVAEKEGKHLIKLMKRKFTLMINNGEPKDFDDDIQEEDSKESLPVEDPRQLEKVILHLVTNLPSPQPEESQRNSCSNGEHSPSHLAIIPPQRERIQRAIEKSYSVIKNIDMAGNRDRKKKINLPSTSSENVPGPSTSSGRSPRSSTSSGRSPRSSTSSRRAPKPSTSSGRTSRPLSTQPEPTEVPQLDDDAQSMMDVLCLGTCQGPPCTCLSTELNNSNRSMSPTEADLYLNLIAGAVPTPSDNNGTSSFFFDPLVNFNDPSFNFSTDPLFFGQEVRKFKKKKTKISRSHTSPAQILRFPTTTIRPIIEPKPVRIRRPHVEPTPGPSRLKRRCQLKDNSTNQVSKRTASVGSCPDKKEDEYIDPELDFMLNMAIEDSCYLERGLMSSSNTVLGSDEIIKTIERIEREDGVFIGEEIAEHMQVQPTVEQMQFQPTVEQMQFQPAVEHMQVQPPFMHMHVQPPVERMQVPPRIEHMQAQPAIEHRQFRPPVTHVRAQTAIRHMQVQPTIARARAQPAASRVQTRLLPRLQRRLLPRVENRAPRPSTEKPFDVYEFTDNGNNH